MIYLKLAFDGIRKNKRLYLPYILTCSMMTAVTYIVDYLHYSKTITEMRGGSTIQEILVLGNFVMAFFSCLFIFYTNSFLIRRRKKEFGLYNILGMGKKNLALIAVCETAVTAAISVFAGIFVGILFSKFTELILLNIIDLGVSYSFSVSWSAVIDVSLVFAGIFLLTLINSVRQVGTSSAINLLKSENLGEKPPRANWLLGLAGLILIGAAYYIAVTIVSPLDAIMAFFIAVLMVIAGTYMTMISGSVMICRLLQKLKRYYYRPNHFVSVSSMAFRMKRNGAGLASICILSTMVLVMISSTSTLYFGEEKALSVRYPREINSEIIMQNIDGLDYETLTSLKEIIDGFSKDMGASVENVVDYRMVSTAGLLFDDGTVDTDAGAYRTASDFGGVVKRLYQFYFVPLEDYNRVCKKSETLGDGEAMAFGINRDITQSELSFIDGSDLKIVKTLDAFPLTGDMTVDLTPAIVLVVKDLKEAVGGLAGLANYIGDSRINPTWIYGFDTGLDPERQFELTGKLWEKLASLDKDAYMIYSRSLSGREDSRREFLELYGGLFFLGIILSATFIFAAVLIIYYKQLSEGYEDCSRFGIMKKVGMTDADIRKSINSQLLTVFFLPLGFAAMHLGFAFPLVKKLMTLFNLQDVSFYGIVTAVCLLVFALMYVLVYRITSHLYYDIVRGGKEL